MTTPNETARQVIQTLLEGGPFNGHDINNCGDYAPIVQDLIEAHEQGGQQAVATRWNELAKTTPRLMAFLCSPDLAPDGQTLTPLEQILAEIEPLPDKGAIQKHLLERIDQAATLSKADLMQLEPKLKQRGIADRWIQQWKGAIQETKDKAKKSQQATPQPPASKVLCQHPETEEDIVLPPGYTLMPWGNDRAIMKFNGREMVHVYTGVISVIGTGYDLHTQEQTITIQWDHNHVLHQRTIPRAALTDSRDFAAKIGGAGATISAENRSRVTAFLIEQARANPHLPHQAHVSRLGLTSDLAFMLPAGSVGTETPTAYIGRTIHLGSDPDIYRETIRDIVLNWNAPLLTLILGASLAAPALTRLRPRRNPTFYLPGMSTIGKTTIVLFSLGVWGDPTRPPFKMEGKKVSPAAFFQTLGELNGLPLFIDEAHTNDRHDHLEGLCYQFANRQRYTRGTLEQVAAGGDDIYGVLFLAGEAAPAFRYGGAHRRIMWCDGDAWLPLGAGAGAQTDLGKQRAEQLERAWETGAGLFGKAYCERLWANWDAFVADVNQFKKDDNIASLSAWADPLAICAAALKLLFEIVVPEGEVDWDFSLWREILEAGHMEADPSALAFEGILTMLAQARNNDGFASYTVPVGWKEERWMNGRRIACNKGDGYWLVLSNTEELQRFTNSERPVQEHGTKWVRNKWVEPSQRGTRVITTTYTVISNGDKANVLKIPEDVIEQWGQYQE
jgi:hypothetical protein